MKDKQKSLNQLIPEIKALSERLIPYTFPLVSIEFEQDILILKQRDILLDGYAISILHSKAQYPENFGIESLQISSIYTPFLPFHIVCKLGRKFLGEDYLGYAEFFKKNEKVYCWTLRYESGTKIPPTDRAKEVSFEGFKYHILPTGYGNLYDC